MGAKKITVSKEQQWAVAGNVQLWNRSKEGTPKTGKLKVDVKKDKKSKEESSWWTILLSLQPGALDQTRK